MNVSNILRLIVVAAALLSIPALLPRMQVERPGPVVLVMDGEAIADEARATGKSFEELALEYKNQGIGGIALYEQSVRSWFDRGLVTYQSAPSLKLLYPVAKVKPGWYYLTGPVELLDRWAAGWTIPTEKIQIGVQTWLGAPLDFGSLPAGFDSELIQKLKADGFYLVARPSNHPYRKFEGSLVPPQTDAVLFGGLVALGWKDNLEAVKTQLAGKPIAQIEGTPQRGFPQLAKSLPVLRLFSLKPEWQDKLSPAEVSDKFLLAARERGHQLLYMRPFDSHQDTLELIRLVKSDLERSHIALGAPKPRDFSPSALRFVALIGILAGLALLALGLPSPWGWPVAGLLALFALGYARGDAGPLLAALVFPVLGFLENRPGLQKWFAAVLYAFAGVIFLAVLGSRPETILGLEPFKGVSLTLVVPPLLVALSFIPKDFKQTINNLWLYPLKLGEVAVALLGLAIVALAVLRRGNDAAPSIVPDWELQLRALLQDVMVRPRFKEIFAHALAPVALLLPWPNWLKNALILLVSVGIASILNTFSHYHTPLSISFFRVLNGMVIGLIVGLIAVWGIRRLRKWWLG